MNSLLAVQNKQQHTQHACVPACPPLVPARLSCPLTPPPRCYKLPLANNAAVPNTLRNPLYHWTHLELKRYFGVSGKLFNDTAAPEIYT